MTRILAALAAMILSVTLAYAAPTVNTWEEAIPTYMWADTVANSQGALNDTTTATAPYSTSGSVFIQNARFIVIKVYSSGSDTLSTQSASQGPIVQLSHDNVSWFTTTTLATTERFLPYISTAGSIQGPFLYFPSKLAVTSVPSVLWSYNPMTVTGGTPVPCQAKYMRLKFRTWNNRRHLDNTTAVAGASSGTITMIAYVYR